MKENEILIYKSNNGPKVDVRLLNDTVWLTQDQMSTLFKKAKSTINEHIKNIYKERELKESQTLQKFGISEFQKKASNYYNLDVIISVGYRVKSQRGTDFRIWAMTILKQHIVDGYTQNTNRLLERKLEIEINESREIMTKMLTTGSSTKQANIEAIDLVSKYLGSATDKEAIILKAHLLIERFLITFNEKHCKNASAFNNSRQTYRQLLELAKSQFEENEHNRLWELLNKLNILRNKFSHTLDVVKSENIINEFLQLTMNQMNSKRSKENIDKNFSLKQTLAHLCGLTFKTIHSDN